MTDDREARLDTPLARALVCRIARNGPISVCEYMAACLYDPDHGYYRHQPVLGRSADFVTAPEISQVFGELIGLWCAVVWQSMGSPASFDLVELGPGRGTLMRDALRATRSVPQFHASAAVMLVECSGALTAIQRTTLDDVDVPIAWHAHSDVLSHSKRPAIIIGNEFLDCQPRRQWVRRGSTWRERLVGIDDRDRLVFQLAEAAGAAAAEIDALAGSATEGDVFEPSSHTQIVGTLATRLTMAALLIDYGHTEPSVGDSFQAVRAHRTEHPLTAPGLADLTMHVDFAALVREVAQRPELAVDGPVPQAAFLGGLGAVERAARLMAANPGLAATIETGVARLLSPHGMGSRFKAIGIRSTHLPPLPGLSLVDNEGLGG